MVDVAETTTGGKRSAWMSHVKKTMKANKGMKLMQVLKMAKKTYKKTGGAGLSAMPLGQEGARRRRRGGEEPVSFGKKVVAADAAAGQDEARMTFGGRRRSRKAGRKGGRRTRKH